MHPLKPSWRTELPALALIVAAGAFAAYIYPQMPDQVPIHWNFAGEVDGYGGKTGAVLMGPLFMVGLYLLFFIFPYLDPKRDSYESFRRPYFIMRTGFLVFFLAISVMTGLSGLGQGVNVGTWMPVLVGALFVMIGNYLSKIRSNWFMGIRTPWTLTDPENWQQTHRFASRTFVFAGVAMAAVPFLPSTLGLGLFIVCVASMLSPIVYSYLLFRKKIKS